MKKIIAIALSSLIASGAYAQVANTKVVTKTTETTVTNSVDDNSRKAILDALDTNDTEPKAIEVKKPAEVKTETKVATKTEAPKTPDIKTDGKPAIVVTKTEAAGKVATTTTEVKTENRPVVVVTQTKTEPVKTQTSAVTPVTESKPVQVTTTTKTETKTTTVTPVVKAEVKPEVKAEVKPVVKAEPKVEVKPVEPVIVAEQKKVVKKKVVKKTVAKKKAPKTDGIDLVKSPTSISEAPYETNTLQTAGLLTANAVQASLVAKNDSSFTVKLTDLNGQYISSTHLNAIRDRSQVVGYWVSNDLKNIEITPLTVYGQTSDFNFTSDKNSACKTLFVQYQLKTASEPTTLKGYVDHSGKFGMNRDAKCVGPSVNSHDNISYSQQNNIVGIFMTDIIGSSTKPLRYSIINNRNGKTYAPASLESFIISKDYSNFYNVQPLQDVRSGIKGTKFIKTVRSGTYYVIGQFPQDNTTQTVVTSVEVQ